MYTTSVFCYAASRKSVKRELSLKVSGDCAQVVESACIEASCLLLHSYTDIFDCRQRTVKNNIYKNVQHFSDVLLHYLLKKFTLGYMIHLFGAFRQMLFNFQPKTLCLQLVEEVTAAAPCSTWTTFLFFTQKRKTREKKIYKKEKMASVTPLDKMVAVTLYWKFALIYCTVYRACRTLHYTRVPGCIIQGLVAVLGDLKKNYFS